MHVVNFVLQANRLRVEWQRARHVRLGNTRRRTSWLAHFAKRVESESTLPPWKKAAEDVPRKSIRILPVELLGTLARHAPKAVGLSTPQLRAVFVIPVGFSL